MSSSTVSSVVYLDINVILNPFLAIMQIWLQHKNQKTERYGKKDLYKLTDEELLAEEKR